MAGLISFVSLRSKKCKTMNRIKLCIAICLFIFSGVSYGQDSKYDMSTPIDLTQNSGWNKVLCMKNGNTMLFHFDRDKPITIKVFDSLHKEKASVEYLPKILNVETFKMLVFKGFFELNGEAVMFFEQERLKLELVRLRFNSDNGTVIEEKQAGESKTVGKKTRFYVMKNKEDEDYAILFSTEDPNFKQCDLHVTYYNNKHESYKDIPLDVDRKKYDYLFVVGAESQPNGVSIMLNLTTLAVNGAPSSVSNEKAIYDHDIAMYYITKSSGKVNKTVVNMSTDIYPTYSKYTYNPFANTLNLLLYSYRTIRYKFGMSIQRGSVSQDLFYISDLNTGGTKLNYVDNKFATASLRQKGDSTKVFYGMPLNMHTNENGLTTLISEGYDRYDEPETQARYNFETYLGNIAVAQVDDDGNELWGTVLPQSECFKSYKRYFQPIEFAKKRTAGVPFSDLPEQVYEGQFLSLNSYFYHKNIYIIYNDFNKNFNSTIDKPGDTVYDFTATNACVYKIDSKREITKHYLFGDPVANEYKCSFIEGADFDEQRGTYATLVQYKHEGDISLRMAWVKMD